MANLAAWQDCPCGLGAAGRFNAYLYLLASKLICLEVSYPMFVHYFQVHSYQVKLKSCLIHKVNLLLGDTVLCNSVSPEMTPYDSRVQ